MNEIEILITQKKYEEALNSINQALRSSENDFYALMQSKMQCLYQLEMYDELNQMIQEEQSMPYIPETFNVQLDSYKQQLKQLKKLQQPVTYHALAEEEIETLLKGNLYDQAHVIDYLESANLLHYEIEIRDYLKSTHGDEVCKTMILEMCSNYRLATIEVYKQGQYYQLTFNEPFKVETHKNYQLMESKIEDILQQDPSLSQLTIEYMRYQFRKQYPNIEQNINLAVLAYIFKVKQMIHQDVDGDELIERYNIDKLQLLDKINNLE